MSALKDETDHGLGRYLSSNDCAIDAEELTNVCRRLGISEPLEPLLRELKNKENSLLTKESPRKVVQRKEKRISNKNTKESLDCGDNSQQSQGGGKTSYGQESWGRDSGARDLSPEPARMHEALMENESSGGTSVMLQLASKLQVAALSALKTEVMELSSRLQNAERERESVQKKLNEALAEKELSQRRLEAVGTLHEGRITEMHCIIAELSKKLKDQQEKAIIEEHETDGSVSELSFQEGSVYNSEMECTNLEQQSQTEPLDVKLVRPDQRSESHYSLPQVAINTVGGQIEMQAMHEEILYLRSHVALLQSKLASVQDNTEADEKQLKLDAFEHMRASPKANSNYTSDDLGETAEIFELSQNEVGRSSKVTSQAIKNVSGQENSQLCENMSATIGIHLPLPSENSGVKSNERIRSRHSGDEAATTDVPDSSMHNEIQRLKQCVEHLRVQNKLLSLSLEESKAHCEHLYLLCGKYESNAIALSQALNCSDRTIEAYDVMLALLESKLGILENAESAIESRKAAETVAKHLMTRLESETNIQGNSLGPWQDASVVYGGSPNSTAPWTDEDDQRLREQMSKLKGQRTLIQNTVVILESPYDPGADRSSNTTKKRVTNHNMENHIAELEQAVLMQELMSMREDLNEFKCRADQAEREKNNTTERLAVMQQALLHLQAQLADSEALLALKDKDRSSYSEAEHSAGIELELVEALARESRLKARLQALAGSLEMATKSSEEKYAQVQNTVAELRQANLSLTQSLDRCKRKYQARLKRMEQQLMEVTLKQNPGNPVPETTL